MAFDAKIFRVLIASPADVGDERQIIPDVINDWNAINAAASKVVLVAIKWESNSAPILGDRAQAIINKQLVKDCDVLVGIFWTRIGTNTGVAISGTVEEIEQFVALNKPVMLYFSQSPIEPDKIDIAQFATLKAFKEKMKLEGLTETYSGIHDFRQKFARQFGINISNLINNALESKIEETETPSSAGKNKLSKKTMIEATTIKPVEVSKEKLTNEKVDEYLIQAVQAAANQNGWARIAAIGSYLHTYTPIDYRDFKFTKLQAFLKSRKLFEFKEDKGHPILRILSK